MVMPKKLMDYAAPLEAGHPRAGGRSRIPRGAHRDAGVAGAGLGVEDRAQALTDSQGGQLARVI